jgi:hypothetical protein
MDNKEFKKSKREKHKTPSGYWQHFSLYQSQTIDITDIIK